MDGADAEREQRRAPADERDEDPAEDGVAGAEVVAARITDALSIPTIGIGAGRDCDGQVLVYHDLIGLYDGRMPRFVKRYADVGGEIRGALERYAADVRGGRFPDEQHTYSIPDNELAEFEADLTEDLQGDIRERR